MLIFKGEYLIALPGLGVFQPGQEIDDPEKVVLIMASSEYKHLFTEIKPQKQKTKKGEDD